MISKEKKNQTRWTPDLIRQVKELWLKGMTKTAISKELNVSRASLQIKCLDLNLVGNPVKGGPHKPRTPKEDKKYWAKKKKDQKVGAKRRKIKREKMKQDGKYEEIKQEQNKASRRAKEYSYEQFLKGDRYHYWQSRLRAHKSGTKDRSTLKNLPFTLTNEHLEEVWISQKGKCSLTNVKLIPGKGLKSKEVQKNLISLDRIDTNKGYEIGNVRFVSDLANTIRRNLSDKELLDICQKIVEVLDKKLLKKK